MLTKSTEQLERVQLAWEVSAVRKGGNFQRKETLIGWGPWHRDIILHIRRMRQPQRSSLKIWTSSLFAISSCSAELQCLWHEGFLFRSSSPLLSSSRRIALHFSIFRHLAIATSSSIAQSLGCVAGVAVEEIPQHHSLDHFSQEGVPILWEDQQGGFLELICIFWQKAKLLPPSSAQSLPQTALSQCLSAMGVCSIILEEEISCARINLALKESIGGGCFSLQAIFILLLLFFI